MDEGSSSRYDEQREGSAGDEGGGGLKVKRSVERRRLFIAAGSVRETETVESKMYVRAPARLALPSYISVGADRQ